MLPYYPARDGYPSMFEADDDAGCAAVCASTCKSTFSAADRERLRSLFRSIDTGTAKRRPNRLQRPIRQTSRCCKSTSKQDVL